MLRALEYNGEIAYNRESGYSHLVTLNSGPLKVPHGIGLAVERLRGPVARKEHDTSGLFGVNARRGGSRTIGLCRAVLVDVRVRVITCWTGVAAGG